MGKIKDNIVVTIILKINESSARIIF